jgi:hypothetical protein
MPVAVNFSDDFAIHEDAESWYHDVALGAGTETVTHLTDGDGEEIGVEVVLSNVEQIQHLTEDEAAELMELL